MNDKHSPLNTHNVDTHNLETHNATHDPKSQSGATEVIEGQDSNFAAASTTTEVTTEIVDPGVKDPSSLPHESEEPAAEVLNPEKILSAIAQERDHLAQQLEEQNQQVDALKQRYISLAAEFDNFRKRSLREKQDLEVQIKCKTLGEILGVVDNFERARTQLKPNSEGEVAIHKSYQSVYKSLVDSLKRLGVSPMRPEGQTFDPLYHEAMLREYTDGHPEGTIIEQLVRGYTLEEQVLRHAMVKVSAGPDPDASTAENTKAEQESESAPDIDINP
jgi:molecular chaperone GrpE